MFSPIQLLFPKKFLGIDIGTSFIKIVEVSRFGYRKKLENYGELSAKVLYEKPFRNFENSTLSFSTEDTARAISAILKEAKIKTRQAIFSIPDFSTFFTNFDLPPMTKKELPQAVRYEAKQHVPLPLEEVTLDWQVIDGKVSEREKTKLKILLATVPNEVINQYRQIAKLAEVQLLSLEAEVFGLLRSLINQDEKGNIAIIDIGAQSTTCNIIKKRNLYLSYSFDMSGNDLTKTISKALSTDYQSAEDLKKKYGISGQDIIEDRVKEDVKQVLIPLIDVIIREVEQIFSNFSQKEGSGIDKIILAGGTALMPGLKEYLSESFKKEIEIANPFSDIFYPPILENSLKQMGPSYAIALGIALRGLEY